MAPLQMAEQSSCVSTMEAPNDSQTPKRKAVSFRSKVSIRRTRNLERFTKEEVKACWYSNDELKTIKHGLRKVIVNFDKGEFSPIESEDFSIRGLESFLPEGKALKFVHREAARNVVLEEQSYQWEHDIVDHELMADLYYEYSIQSLRLAQIRAFAYQEEEEKAIAPETSNSDESNAVKETLPLKRPNSELYRSNSIRTLERRKPSFVSSRAA